MDEEAKDEQVGDGPANKSGPPPADEPAIKVGQPHEFSYEILASTPGKSGTVGPSGPAWLTAIAALIAAGLTGIAAVIKAWAQLLFARADMVRARAGQPAVEGDQGGSEPGEGANGGTNQTGA